MAGSLHASAWLEKVEASCRTWEIWSLWRMVWCWKEQLMDHREVLWEVLQLILFTIHVMTVKL